VFLYLAVFGILYLVWRLLLPFEALNTDSAAGRKKAPAKAGAKEAKPTAKTSIKPPVCF
jgi:hypothetical protein